MLSTEAGELHVTRMASERIAAVADEVVCVQAPPFFSAVGQWYERFDQTEDDEVRELLARSQAACGINQSRAV